MSIGFKRVFFLIIATVTSVLIGAITHFMLGAVLFIICCYLAWEGIKEAPPPLPQVCDDFDERIKAARKHTFNSPFDTREH